MPVESQHILVVVLLAGAVLVYLFGQIFASRKLGRLTAQLEAAEQRLNAQTAAREDLERELGALRTEVALLTQQRDTALDALKRREDDLREQGKRLEAASRERSAIERQLASDRSSLEGERKALAERDGQIAQLKAELADLRKAKESVESERYEISQELATLKTSLAEKQEHFDKQLAQLDEQKGILKKEFQNLANEILETKGKAFSEQSQASLENMLKPFREQINDFKGKVENLHLEGTKQQTEMRTELKQLQTMHQQMTQEAHNLAVALKGQKKVQGNWGELVLENILDRSGLRLGTDYRREDSFQHEEGGRGRPDVVVYLPQGKHLIIDAKVSLNDYTRYINAEDELERQQALKAHVKAFADRIKELADRDYYRLKGVNSPEMVFMFVPIESAFVEALKADESLFEKAIEQNVLVATPTTLLTSLNIVRQLWRYEEQNKHTAELAGKADKVFRKLKTFLTSFDGVRKGLEKAQESYNKAESQLVSGAGNLVKQVNEFKQLAPSIRDSLPEHYTEKAELEIEYHPADAEEEPGEPLALEADTDTETETTTDKENA